MYFGLPGVSKLLDYCFLNKMDSRGILLLSLLTCALGDNTPIYGGGPQGKSYHQPSYDYKPIPYDFAYAVQDSYTSNFHGRSEVSDGKSVTGRYFVLLPDGRTQIVTYTADHINGFQAHVTYEGEAKYPSYSKHNHNKAAYRENVAAGSVEAPYLDVIEAQPSYQPVLDKVEDSRHIQSFGKNLQPNFKSILVQAEDASHEKSFGKKNIQPNFKPILVSTDDTRYDKSFGRDFKSIYPPVLDTRHLKSIENTAQQAHKLIPGKVEDTRHLKAIGKDITSVYSELKSIQSKQERQIPANPIIFHGFKPIAAPRKSVNVN